MSGRVAERLTYVTPKARVARVEIGGQPIFFLITKWQDAIQKSHRTGRFYEERELGVLLRYCPKDAVYCDIGANIGNHTLYALKFMGISKAILFEPNQTAIDILLANLNLNGVLDKCDTSFLGIGLSDHEGEGYGIEAPEKNLGAAEMTQGAGEIRIARGDRLLNGQKVDLVKIDVEGMEMEVLRGLRGVIEDSRPTMFVEVRRETIPEFEEWLTDVGYEIRETTTRNRVFSNFVILPREASDQL
jgi:FkbM family methyltransferase